MKDIKTKLKFSCLFVFINMYKNTVYNILFNTYFFIFDIFINVNHKNNTKMKWQKDEMYNLTFMKQNKDKRAV